MALADQLPVIWHNASTEPRLKQRIVALLIEQIIVDLDRERDELHLTIRWAGGRHTELRHAKRGRSSSYTNSDTIEIVRKMAGKWSDEKIALTLNRLGHRTGKGFGWTVKRVQSLRYTHKIQNPHNKHPILTMSQAASELGVSRTLVERLIRDDVLRASQAVFGAPWEIDPNELQSEKVRTALKQRLSGRPCIAADSNQLSIFSDT